MLADWTSLKSVLVNRGLSAQCVVVGPNYWIKAVDGVFELECVLPTDTANEDSLDFVTNFLPTANKQNSTHIQGVVTTQFEMRDKTLKLAHGESDVDPETGLATAILKIPGTPGSSDGRWISSGTAFFDDHTPGDKVIGVYFTDEDNILGAGAGTVIGSYTDDDSDEANRGWAIPPPGWVKCEAIGGYGFAPAGFYIKVIAKKAGESPSGKFYCNFEWGKTEA